MNFSLLASTRARRSREKQAKLPRFEAGGISIATIAASSQCDSEFFVVGSCGDHEAGGQYYGDYARPFGQPHTIANGYATGDRARLMSL